ncbi:hypothetical protein ACO2RV_07050 [Ancylobacter sp. VNQ12]|uniref:hypothetical protein n=1 Tax=Ancylobacter sp. VNQ12 TaxID=3400920 RepID=UPI003C0F1D8E
MANMKGGSNGADEVVAASSRGATAATRPGASPKPLRVAAPADLPVTGVARPERRYSFNMLVATALLAFAAGRIYGR